MVSRNLDSRSSSGSRHPIAAHPPQAAHFHVRTARPLNLAELEAMPAATARASAILAEFGQAQAELVGKVVILTDGKAGTVENIWLDEFHGLRISIRGHEGKWPVSTVKFAQR